MNYRLSLYVLLMSCVCITTAFPETDFWQEKSNGLYGGTVTHLAINSSGHIFAGTSSAGMFRSTDHGEHWTQMTNGPNGALDLDINSSGDIFALNRSGVFRSTDNGENWTQVNTFPTQWESVMSTPCLTISPSGDIFVGGWGIIRSTDNGESWTPVNNGSINRDFILYDPYGEASDVGLAYIRINSIITNSLGHIFAGTFDVAYSDRGTYLINIRSAIFRSTDNGESWTPFSNGLPEHAYILSLAINSSGCIFAGTGSDGIFMSKDNGETWEEINTGLKKTEVYALALDSRGFLYAAVGGVFRSVSPTPTGAITSIDTSKPLSFALYQNYPNPFNASTTIHFVLPMGSFVSLRIYDILGQEAATLFDGFRDAGTYSARWDASSFANGVYITVMKAGSITRIKKIVVMK